MRRKVHLAALLWLVVVLAITALAIWFAYLDQVADPRMVQYGRPKGWGSVLGEHGTLIALIFAPLIVYLCHKAFFSSFRR